MTKMKHVQELYLGAPEQPLWAERVLPSHEDLITTNIHVKYTYAMTLNEWAHFLGHTVEMLALNIYMKNCDSHKAATISKDFQKNFQVK